MFSFYYTLNLFKLTLHIVQSTTISSEYSGPGLWRICSPSWPYLTPTVPHQAQHQLSLCLRFILAKTGVTLSQLLSFYFDYKPLRTWCLPLIVFTALFIIKLVIWWFCLMQNAFLTLYLLSSNWEKKTPYTGKSYFITTWKYPHLIKLTYLLLTKDGNIFPDTIFTFYIHSM